MSTELAWAAGFFDGEGSVYVRHTLKHRGGNGKMYPLLTVELSLCQVEKQPVDRFLAVVGIGRINGPYKPKGPGQPYYRWDTAGRPSVCAVLTMLWPYMSEPKRAKAVLCWNELRARATKKSPKLPALPS